MVESAGEEEAGGMKSGETTGEVAEAGAVTAKTEKMGSTFVREVRPVKEVVAVDTWTRVEAVGAGTLQIVAD